VKPADIPKLIRKYGSLREIGRRTGVGYDSVRRRYVKAVEAGLMQPIATGRPAGATIKHPDPVERVKALKPKRARHKCYILTSAQNNTRLHEGTWESLKALAEYYGAEIYVSTFLYARNTKFQRRLDKSQSYSVEDIWYDERVVPYINNQRVEIAKGLVWCGELNISPTATRPLFGLEVYTHRASMVAPHVKQELESIATVGGSGAKLNYTTGTVTLRNYIQRREGLRAEFFHTYGALVVEVNDEGHWWVRQLNADSDGVICDLDVRVEDGKITKGNRVEAITFGDIHEAEMDPVVREATWGTQGMVNALRPKYQFLHDSLDFQARDYHRLNDPYPMFKRHVQGRESVGAEIKSLADFLRWIKRDDCETIAVNSNHDRFLGGWLAKNDGRRDPVNAEFWSKLNLAAMEYIRVFQREPDYLSLAMSLIDPTCPVRFLGHDESFVICPDHGGGIECSMHGDIGPNGARGNISSFARLGRRSNTGHSHVARIRGGAFQGGTKSKLRLEYNHGPSSWTHSDIITHTNGKRQIVTFFGGEWRA
jgi:hypothetical protein